jgi:hypothetical protein
MPELHVPMDTRMQLTKPAIGILMLYTRNSIINLCFTILYEYPKFKFASVPVL